MAQANSEAYIPDFNKDIAHFTQRQLQAIAILDSGFVKFLLYGGALGGGKSYFLRWYGVRRLMAIAKIFGINGAVGMLACEDYPALKDRQLAKIGVEFPAWLGKLHEDHKVYGRCFMLTQQWGGGVLCFRNLDDPSKYASAEFAFILVDELTKNLYDVFTHLRARLRWPGLPDIECQFVAGTNPGSIGHGWVKQLWMDKNFPEEFYSGGIDYRPQFAYVPSKADDNPYLDAAYWSMLSTLPEGLRKAFRDGDWNIFVGQAFPDFGPSHIIEPVPVPETAPLYMTYDWGFGKPFSIGWWWVDNDGRVYRFAEWYGWSGTPDQGLRLADSDVARQIKVKEEQLNISRRAIIRLAGPDCFSKRPDYKGGGQGPPTAEIFSNEGIYLTKGDPSRETKIRQFRERLRVPIDGTRPMLQVYNTCKEFIRTIPYMAMDKNNIEDVDTTGEDHCYDEACHICMARPIAMEIPKTLRNVAEIRIDMMEQVNRDPDAAFIKNFNQEDSVWESLLSGEAEIRKMYYEDVK